MSLTFLHKNFVRYQSPHFHLIINVIPCVLSYKILHVTFSFFFLCLLQLRNIWIVLSITTKAIYIYIYRRGVVKSYKSEAQAKQNQRNRTERVRDKGRIKAWNFDRSMTSRRGFFSKPSHFLPAAFDDSETCSDPNSPAGAMSKLEPDEANVYSSANNNTATATVTVTEPNKNGKKKVHQPGSSSRSSKKTEGGGGSASYGHFFGPPSLPVDIPNRKRRDGDEVVDDGGGVRIPPNEYLPRKGRNKGRDSKKTGSEHW